jgi:predicted dehydrogenase
MAAPARIGMGLVGAGFVGPHHVDAVRRLGYVDVVAVAGSNDVSSRESARRLEVPRSYGSFEDLVNDPGVTVVHVATPNYLHGAVISAAIARGKHVVSEKPLALNSVETGALVDQARRAGIVHAVMFNYRGNPLVQEARIRVRRGDIGKPHFLHGHYLQDWLLEDSDYSWRLEPGKGGASSALGDIGSHWCDLAEHVSGLRIVEVLGELRTVVRRRRKPTKAHDAFATASHDATFEWVDVEVEDLASVLLRFDNGAAGNLAVGQVCAGHKNDLTLEICGGSASVAWRQEQQNELWIGRRHEANGLLPKDPPLMAAENHRYARLPGGHQEGWADAFFNVIRDIYAYIADTARARAQPTMFATFEDGHRAACVVEAILKSAKAGGVWTAV